MARLTGSGGAALLAIGGLLACGGEEQGGPRSVSHDFVTPPAVQEVPPEAVPATAPAALGGLRGDPLNGRALYSQYCVTCHGEKGKGDGPAGRSLNPHPADHSNTQYMGGLSDQHIFTAIQRGGAAVGKSPLMAPWGGVLPDSDIRDLVAFVRMLSGT